MIKRLLLVLICVLLVTFPLTVSAKPEALPRVFDGDDLLTSTEEASLLTRLNALSEQYGYDITIVTVPSLEGCDVEEYSDAFYEEADYGMGEYKSGFMLLICLEYRDWALTSYGNAGDKFTYSKITYVRENIMPHLSDDELYEAFEAFADSCEYVLENHGKVTFNPLWIVIAIVIGVIIAFVTVLIMKSQLKSVRFQPAANNYLKNGSLNITHSRDIFLYSTISRRAKPQQTSASKIGAAGPRQSGKF